MRAIVDTSVDPEFSEWAFGKGACIAWKQGLLEDIDLMYLWNGYHGEKLKLNPTDIIKDCLEKMIHIYKAHHANLHSNDS